MRFFKRRKKKKEEIDWMELGTYPRSQPSDFRYQFDNEWFIPQKDNFSFYYYSFYRYIRDHIPDVAAGIWAWTRLTNTPYTVEYYNGTKQQKKQAQEIIENLDARVYEHAHEKNAGFSGILNQFFLAVFTYGAFAGEIVLNNDRTGVDKFVSIDVGTIRFKRHKTSRLVEPFQVVNDKEIKMNPTTFFYYGLDPDGDNPYGRSLLQSLPFVTRVQQKMLEDMSRSMHNAGYPRLQIKYHPPERERGESATDYRTRIEKNMGSLRKGLKDINPDENFVTLNNVEIVYLSPNSQTVTRWYENHKAIEEQIISGLHLAPFMIGRNYGSTYAWAQAQYDLIIRNALSIQDGAKRMVEWIRNLELALNGSQVKTKHLFSENPTLAWLEEQIKNETDKNVPETLTEDQIIG